MRYIFRLPRFFHNNFLEKMRNEKNIYILHESLSDELFIVNTKNMSNLIDRENVNISHYNMTAFLFWGSGKQENTYKFL